MPAIALQQSLVQSGAQCRHGKPTPGGSRAPRLAGGAPLRWRHERRRQQHTQVQRQRGDAQVLSSQPDDKSDAAKTTEKWGLEAGLFKVWTAKGADGKSKGQQAKDLLARYGSAYLITSISFAIVSMAACYVAVDSGLDVAALLRGVGLQVSDRSEAVGTFAIAYAAHKALSPVRFPPTVALTPLVARWLGKEPAASASGSGSE